MARDYKHQARQNTSSGPSVPGWVWLIAGFAFGFATAAGIGLTKAPIVTQQAVEETNNAKVIPQTEDTQATTEKTDDGPRFDFYKMLPNFEVVIPETEDVVDATNKPVEVEKPGLYVLQAGSFQNPADADRLKAKLVLLGLEAHLQEVTIDNDQTWHRVRIGPMADLDKLNTAQQRLRENGIPALVIQVGE